MEAEEKALDLSPLSPARGGPGAVTSDAEADADGSLELGPDEDSEAESNKVEE